MQWQIRKTIRRLISRKNYICTVCGKAIYNFNQISEEFLRQISNNDCIHNIFKFETLNILDYSCPKCGASDRNRLYALYLKEYLKVGNFKLLDFAPSFQLRKFIKSYTNVEYKTADYYRNDVDIKVDIQNMDVFPNEFFDFVICSHVLEHVDNDTQALSELYRILKKGGKGIVMAPICLDLKDDYENPVITDYNGRWKHFAQFDHLRVYSKNGFVKKINNVGFKVRQLGIDFFGESAFSKYGIHSKSVLYLVSK